jgi:arylsulfatase A-like enzyme
MRKTLAVLATAAVLPIFTQVPASAAPNARPNILVIVTDDQRSKGSFELMPEVKRLGAEGAVFNNAFATTPFCCPSRASIFTGLYVHNHGIKNSPTRNQYISVNSRSVVQDFHVAGYRTYFSGKYLNHWPYDIAPAGFDEWAIIPSVGAWYTGQPWNVNGAQEPQDGTYSTHYIRDHGLQFLADSEVEDDAAPWMMFLNPINPHGPATPEPAYANLPVSSFTPLFEKDRRDKPAYIRKRGPIAASSIRALRAKQLRSLKSIDDMLGAIRARLAETGEENTIIVFTSDNGLAWGEHGLGGKTTPYTPSVKVPLYVSWPGHITPGHRSNLVALLDLAPTFLRLANVPTTKVLDGRNIFGAPRKQLLLEFYSWKRYFVPTWKSFITPTLQYTEYYRLDGRFIEREAYNMARDPRQWTNLYRDGRPGNDPPITGSHQRLRGLAACDGTACP